MSTKIENRQIARAMVRQRLRGMIPNPDDIQYLVGHKVTRKRAEAICDEFCTQTEILCKEMASDTEAVRNRKQQHKARRENGTTRD